MSTPLFRIVKAQAPLPAYSASHALLVLLVDPVSMGTGVFWPRSMQRRTFGAIVVRPLSVLFESVR